MNHFLVYLLFIVSLSYSLSNEIYSSDIKRIKDRGELIVAQFRGERPGFFAFDDSNRFSTNQRYLYKEKYLIGYDIELAQKIAAELGVSLRIKRDYSSFNEVAKAVALQKADIAISKLSITTDRSQYLKYTKPYISLRMALLVNRLYESKLGIDKKNPLFACQKRGVPIGVLGQSSFEDHIRKVLPDATIIPYQTQDELFKAVREGIILALLYEEYEIGKFMRKEPDMPIYCHTLYLSNQKDDIAMAVSGKSESLHSFLTTFMQKESIHSTVKELLENYIPEDELRETLLVKKSPFKEITFYIALTASLFLSLLWLSFSRIKKGDHNGQ